MTTLQHAYGDNDEVLAQAVGERAERFTPHNESINGTATPTGQGPVTKWPSVSDDVTCNVF